MNTDTDMLKSVEQYYSEKIKRFGASPAGVDWNGEASQKQRFFQLSRILQGTGPFRVGDLGCGYGAMLGFLKDLNYDVDYTGIDISAEMVRTATELWPKDATTRFEIGSKFSETMEYTLASGIFNVRGETPDAIWTEYFYDTIMHLNDVSEKGFAFNCLTVFSDPPRMQAKLFYADPCDVFRFAKRTVRGT